MTAVIDKNRLGGVLQQAKKKKWDLAIPPAIPARLMLAIDSLKRIKPVFWEEDIDYLAQLLSENPGVSTTFNHTDDLTLSFAIRQARLAHT